MEEQIENGAVAGLFCSSQNEKFDAQWSLLNLLLTANDLVDYWLRSAKNKEISLKHLNTLKVGSELEPKSGSYNFLNVIGPTFWFGNMHL